MIYSKQVTTSELLVPDYSEDIKRIDRAIAGLTAQASRIEMNLNSHMYYEQDADEIVGTWIDGNEIHRRVYTREFKELHFQDSGTGGKTAVLQIEFLHNIRDMIKMDVMSSSLPGFVGQYCDPSNGGNWGVAGDYFRVFFQRTEKNVYVTCGNANPPRPFKVICIMYFTTI